MTTYIEKQNADAVAHSLVVFERDARRREEQKKAQLQIEYEANLTRYRQATQAVTEGKERVKDAQKLLQQWTRYTESAQRTLDELAEAGFTPPEAPAPKVNPNPSIIAKPTPKTEPSKLEYEDIYTVAERTTCEVCGTENVPAACAYHKLAELGDGIYCIRDEKRARSSGLNPAVIESNLERQRAAAGLTETEPEPAVKSAKKNHKR